MISGYREEIVGPESERQGAVMSQVFSKQLWKQTVLKVIQVREILFLFSTDFLCVLPTGSAGIFHLPQCDLKSNG